MNTYFTLSITRRLGSTLLRGVGLSATLALILPLVHAETVVTGPGASGEGNVEFGEPLGGTATLQYIIPSSALIAFQNQTIRGIAFRADSNNDPVAPAYGFASLKISVGSTSLATLSGASTTFAANNVGATTTYDGAFYYTNPLPGGGSPNAFGDVIYFTTPYAYTTGNLIITISHTTHVKQSDGSGAAHPGTADAYTNTGGTLFASTYNAVTSARWDEMSPVTALTTDAPPSNGKILIDTFTAGSSFTLQDTSGTASYNLTTDSSILGGSRQIRVRAAGSGFYGPSVVAVNVTAGTFASYGTDNADRFAYYGTAIGSNTSTGAGPGTPVALHLDLSLTDTIQFDVAQVPTNNPDGTSTQVTIQVFTASGVFSYSKRIDATGTCSIPLSSFSGLSALGAADVLGLGFNFSSNTANLADALVVNELSINQAPPAPPPPAPPAPPPPAPLSGQTLQVFPDATNYLAAGGTVSYEVVVNYTGTPSALGLRVIPPTDWSYTATTGTNAPICLDAIGAKQGSGNEGFGWFYFTAPASPARFTVKFTYPAGQTGDKAVSFAALCYDSTGPAVPVSPAIAVPALLAPPVAPTAPTITTQPASATLAVGAAASFGIVATGTAPLSYQWSKAGKPITGATNQTYAIASTGTADAGNYTATVTNAKGSVTSSAAVLVVSDPAKITTQPKGTTVVLGGTFTLSAQATSAAPMAYQWYFNNAPIAGATQATYSASSASGANTGYYEVKITNSVDSTGVRSEGVLVQVSPAGTTATHQVVTTSGRGYSAGGTLTITNTIAFPSAATALGWTVMLPTGFSLASDTTGASSKPAAGTTARLDWAWDAGALKSPLTFTYTVNVPANATGTKAIGAFASVRMNGDTLPIIGTPDPLAIAQAGLLHSTDTDGDWKISGGELAQTIALFNTTNGNVRTGAYKYVTADLTGPFSADPSVSTGVPVPGNIHSADTNADGMIDLKELLQLIDLYNYRVGTNQTGSYHWQADETGTGVDKYAPGP